MDRTPEESRATAAADAAPPSETFTQVQLHQLLEDELRAGHLVVVRMTCTQLREFPHVGPGRIHAGLLGVAPPVNPDAGPGPFDIAQFGSLFLGGMERQPFERHREYLVAVLPTGHTG